jgi:hypothetical protein
MTMSEPCSQTIREACLPLAKYMLAIATAVFNAFHVSLLPKRPEVLSRYLYATRLIFPLRSLLLSSSTTKSGLRTWNSRYVPSFKAKARTIFFHESKK